MMVFRKKEMKGSEFSENRGTVVDKPRLKVEGKNL